MEHFVEYLMIHNNTVLKEKDLQIISHLRNNARMSLRKMSRKIQVPISTIFDRLKKTEGLFVKKHTSLLNFSKLGFSTQASISLKVSREGREALRVHLMSHESVNSLYRINNGYDFMIECIFRDMKQMEKFMENIDCKFEIEEKKSYLIVEYLKREDFMNNTENMHDVQDGTI